MRIVVDIVCGLWLNTYMQAKLILPSGRIIKSASQCRYVLVYDGDRPCGPSIVKRSDDPIKLRKLKTKHRDCVVMDSHSGNVVFR